MEAGIYKIENPNGKIYIGQSKNVKERIRRYKKLQCCKFQLLLYRSFLKYGIENHTFDILKLGSFTKEALNNLEKEYIIQYDSYRQNNKKGMNLTTGGDSIEFDKSVREKMSKTRIRKFKEGQRNSKISINNIYDIKKLIAYNKPLKEIADKYKVAITTISEIKAGRSWSDVPSYTVPENEKHLINRTNKKSRLQKLTEKQRKEIIERYLEGNITYLELSKDYNISKSGVQAVMRSYKKFGK